MQRYRPTWADINLGNIAYNVKGFRKHIPGPTRLMAVVKADGYGHGAAEVAGRPGCRRRLAGCSLGRGRYTPAPGRSGRAYFDSWVSAP
jgi:hypothetical protein